MLRKRCHDHVKSLGKLDTKYITLEDILPGSAAASKIVQVPEVASLSIMNSFNRDDTDFS